MALSDRQDHSVHYQWPQEGQPYNCVTQSHNDKEQLQWLKEK